MTLVRRGNCMQGLSQHVKRTRELREVLFWLLLLGSWQLLAAPGKTNAVLGAAGTAVFLVFAWWNLGKLTRLGLVYASWRPTTDSGWVVAALSGLIAGAAIYAVGSAIGQNMKLSHDWRIVVLQVTLGPLLEELVFRGYLFALLAWLFRRLARHLVLDWLITVLDWLITLTAAVIFAVVHLAQPGVSFLQLACITSTGTLYGWIRHRWGSTAPAAAAHAIYNLTLYVAVGVAAFHE